MKDASIVTGFLFALAIAVVGSFVFSIMWIANEFSFPSQQAQIEQLRKDAGNVDPQQAEDVIGQVTQWNQEILSNQVNNKLPIVGLTIPDGWDSIQVIEVPSR